MTSLIRMAEQRDCAELAKVHVASWQTAYKGLIDQDYLDNLNVEDREKGWSKNLIENQHKIYLQFDSDRLIGFASSCQCRDDDALSSWDEIATFYFLERYWGKGHSHALMSHILAKIDVSGNAATTVWVLRKNLRAQKFYAKHGFVLEGKEKIVQRGPIVLDDLRMIRKS